jgi:hypothetical protein
MRRVVSSGYKMIFGILLRRRTLRGKNRVKGILLRTTTERQRRFETNASTCGEITAADTGEMAHDFSRTARAFDQR